MIVVGAAETKNVTKGDEFGADGTWRRRTGSAVASSRWKSGGAADADVLGVQEVEHQVDGDTHGDGDDDAEEE